MTKIKLCGLTRPLDIQAVNELRPDYVGFVCYSQSRRFVTPAQAATLKKLLDPAIRTVGVFVDESPENIAVLLAKNVIDIAQHHGHESPDYCKQLRTLTDHPIIKAFRVQRPEDCLPAEQFPSDFLLLDSGMGSGVTFDWSAVSQVRREYFLAGGLHAGNVATAIKKMHAFAVDVSSGIESKGVKDFNKMAAFVAAVREEDSR